LFAITGVTKSPSLHDFLLDRLGESNVPNIDLAWLKSIFAQDFGGRTISHMFHGAGIFTYSWDDDEIPYAKIKNVPNHQPWINKPQTAV